MLLVCALAWGVTFVAQRLATQSMGETPFTFNAARFIIGSLLVAPFMLRGGRLAARATWVGGVAAGLAMVGGASLQQAAMGRVTAGTAGFITGTYVIWVPLLGLLWGQWVSMRVWLAVALAAAGLWFISAQGSFAFAPAEVLLIASTVIWAVQVQVIGWAATRGDPIGIAFVQFVVTAICCSIGALALEPVSLDLLKAGAGPILFSGTFSIALAFTLQVLAQSSAPPAHAAIIMSLESVFAEASGSIWMNEGFGARKWFGAALILAGALAATVTGPRRPPQESARPQEPAAG